MGKDERYSQDKTGKKIKEPALAFELHPLFNIKYNYLLFFAFL